MKRMMLGAITAATFCLSSIAAYADTVTLTLTNPIQNAFPSGGVLTYAATVFAPLTNTAELFLNADSFNLASPLSLDDTGFFVDFPLSLMPGQSFTGNLFTVTVPAGSARGTYNGFFSIFGGGNGAAQDLLGTVSFVTTVPEPSSMFLALAALAGLARSRRTSGSLSPKS